MPPVLGQFPLITLREKVNKFKVERGGFTLRMMNEAQSTIHCRMWTDEKLTDPWICVQDLELYFAAIRLAPREDRLTLRDIGFL